VGLLRPPGKEGLETKVCDTSYASFRFWFDAGLRVLSCHEMGFKSHSLRRGGATARVMKGYTLLQIMLEGRWSCESSCRLYLKTAEAAVLNIRRDINPSALILCRSLGASWELVAYECSCNSLTERGMTWQGLQPPGPFSFVEAKALPLQQ
jgi:hypothetical protein